MEQGIIKSAQGEDVGLGLIAPDANPAALVRFSKYAVVGSWSDVFAGRRVRFTRNPEDAGRAAKIELL